MPYVAFTTSICDRLSYWHPDCAILVFLFKLSLVQPFAFHIFTKFTNCTEQSLFLTVTAFD